MIRVRKGIVLEIQDSLPNFTIVKVLVEGEEARAIHYPQIGGEIKVGAEVILNTTAKDMGLGTGGYHFILHTIDQDRLDPQSSGHIMKIRYTPYQLKVLSVEEEDSPHHQTLKQSSDLDSMPVIVAPLHSMVTPIVAVLKNLQPDIKIAYLMSDGAALPLPFSRLVRTLKGRGWLESTVTFGHAFGGDYEAVNVYTALLTAKWVIKADIAIIAMGPGIVGTGTPLGFTGVEQADFLHATSILGGNPIAVPRVSFADPRPRHRGISHHSQTVLGRLTLTESTIGLPLYEGEKGELICEQLYNSGIEKKHQVSFFSPDLIRDLLVQDDLKLETMGRKFSEEEEFFLTAGFGGYLALHQLNDLALIDK